MPEVTLYATHTCGFCQKALRWLAEHSEASPFVIVRFVDEDDDARESFRAHGFRGVPAFVADHDQWSGWNPERLERVLAGATEPADP